MMSKTKQLFLLMLAMAFLVGANHSFAVTMQDSGDEDQQKSEQKDSDESAEQSEPEMPVVKETKSKRPTRRSYSKRGESFLSAFAEAVGSTSEAVVEIKNGKRRIALGTVVDAEKGFILTKASELKGDLKCKFSDGTEIEPTVFGVDPKTDLVLLQVEKAGLTAASLENEEAPQVGAWLATVNHNSTPLAVGIVSHDVRLIRSRKLNSAVVGIRPVDRNEGDGVRINVVFSGSPADEAGLLVNDVILQIDGDVIKDREALVDKLSIYFPGQEITLRILRDDEESDIKVTLGKQNQTLPMRDRGAQQNRMGSRLSTRRSDFPLALQHDTALNANDCGGPLVDLSGSVIGINIARDGRVSSLALPNDVVLPILEKLKSGKMLPALVNKDAIISVEKELVNMESDLKTLPKEQQKKEVELSVGNAIEKELKRQVKEAEERLKELQARLDKKDETNKAVESTLSGIKRRHSQAKRGLDPLKKKLNMLKTGIE